MQLHIGILHEDRIPEAAFQDFTDSIRAPGLIFERKTRPSGVPFAGVEWLMPTVVLAYVAKPYFESFLKEMGKDHYEFLKKGFNNLYEWFAGPSAPNVQIIATPGKSSKEQPYSLFFSVVADAPDGVRLKLLIPRPIESTEYEIAISKFFDLIQSKYNGTIEQEVATTFKDARITSGTVLVTYEVTTGKLVPVDPVAGRRSQNK
jgi:hypothetical protein